MAREEDHALGHPHAKETLTGDKTKDDIARATVLLQEIVKEHAGTPWAALCSGN